jgi:glycosyltransferase involved in cell wall biosynthesis
MIPGKEFDYHCLADLSPQGIPATGKLRPILNALRAIRGALLASRFSIVHVHSLDIYQAFICLGARRKLIVSCMGSDILELYDKSNGLLRMLFDRVLRRADAITCDASSVLKALVAAGVDEGKIRIIMWGVDTEEFLFLPQPEKDAIRRRFGLSIDALVFLSIRSLHPLYRIKELIEQYKRTVTRRDMILFIHVSPYSDPNYVAECRGAAASATNIIFNEHPVAPERLVQIYNAADASLHFPITDAAPVSMLESIACGNVIICDEGIAAYRELAQTYSIKMTQLTEINEDMLGRAASVSRERAMSNRELLINRDSRRATSVLVRSLREGVGSGFELTE